MGTFFGGPGGLGGRAAAAGGGSPGEAGRGALRTGGSWVAPSPASAGRVRFRDVPAAIPAPPSALPSASPGRAHQGAIVHARDLIGFLNELG